MSLNRAHRVIAIEPNTWTLLLVGPKRQDWAFYVHDRQEVAAGSVGMVQARGPVSGELIRWNVHPLVPAQPVRVPWQAYIAQGGNPDPFSC
jgi:hypothetical protein